MHLLTVRLVCRNPLCSIPAPKCRIHRAVHHRSSPSTTYPARACVYASTIPRRQPTHLPLPVYLPHSTSNTSPTTSAKASLPPALLSSPVPSTTVLVSRSSLVLSALATVVASVWASTSMSGFVPPRMVVEVRWWFGRREEESSEVVVFVGREERGSVGEMSRGTWVLEVVSWVVVEWKGDLGEGSRGDGEGEERRVNVPNAPTARPA